MNTSTTNTIIPTNPHPFSSVGIVNQIVFSEIQKYNKILKSTYRNDLDINEITSALGCLNRIKLKLRDANEENLDNILFQFKNELKRAASDAEQIKIESPITYSMTLEDIKVANAVLDEILFEYEKGRARVDSIMRKERAYRAQSRRQKRTV